MNTNSPSSNESIVAPTFEPTPQPTIPSSGYGGRNGGLVHDRMPFAIALIVFTCCLQLAALVKARSYRKKLDRLRITTAAAVAEADHEGQSHLHENDDDTLRSGLRESGFGRQSTRRHSSYSRVRGYSANQYYDVELNTDDSLVPPPLPQNTALGPFGFR